jgi:hypothetical protein
LKGVFVAQHSLGRVRLGTNLVLYGLVLTLLSIIGAVLVFIVLLFLVLVRFAGQGAVAVLQQAPPGIEIPIVMLTILPATSLLVSFVGKLLCLGGPEGMPAKGAIYLSLVCDVLAVIASVILFSADPKFNGVPILFKVMGLLSLIVLLSPIGFVPFTVFLQRLGSWKLSRSPVPGEAADLLKLGAVVTGLLLVAFSLAAVDRVDIGGGFGSLGTLLALVFVARYIGLLHTTKSALAIATETQRDEAR